MGRSEGFEDEAVKALRNLNYSEDEIAATAGQLPTELGTEERLRRSLRALDARHSEQTLERHAPAVQPNPKMFEKQESPPKDEDEAYNRGRRDERYLKRNDPNYVRPPRPARPKSAATQRREMMAPVRKWGSLAKKAQGRRR